MFQVPQLLRANGLIWQPFVGFCAPVVKARKPIPGSFEGLISELAFQSVIQGDLNPLEVG